MKHYKTVTIPESSTQKLYKTTCDLCNDKFEIDEYYIDEVSIQYKTGSNYPEGGSGKTIGVDMCPDCFISKLIPWLKSQGCKMHVVDWDW